MVPSDLQPLHSKMTGSKNVVARRPGRKKKGGVTGDCTEEEKRKTAWKTMHEVKIDEVPVRGCEVLLARWLDTIAKFPFEGLRKSVEGYIRGTHSIDAGMSSLKK